VLRKRNNPEVNGNLGILTRLLGESRTISFPIIGGDFGTEERLADYAPTLDATSVIGATGIGTVTILMEELFHTCLSGTHAAIEIRRLEYTSNEDLVTMMQLYEHCFEGKETVPNGHFPVGKEKEYLHALKRKISRDNAVINQFCVDWKVLQQAVAMYYLECCKRTNPELFSGSEKLLDVMFSNLSPEENEIYGQMMHLKDITRNVTIPVMCAYFASNIPAFDYGGKSIFPVHVAETDMKLYMTLEKADHDRFLGRLPQRFLTTLRFKRLFETIKKMVEVGQFETNPTGMNEAVKRSRLEVESMWDESHQGLMAHLLKEPYNTWPVEMKILLRQLVETDPLWEKFALSPLVRPRTTALWLVKKLGSKTYDLRFRDELFPSVRMQKTNMELDKEERDELIQQLLLTTLKIQIAVSPSRVLCAERCLDHCTLFETCESCNLYETITLARKLSKWWNSS
jgi:hypothetical protein